MSIRHMTAVWDDSYYGGTDKSKLLIALAIADYAGEDGSAWPSIETLAKKARTSVRHAQRAVRELEQDGRLSIVPQQGPNGVNLYYLRGVTSCRGGDMSGHAMSPKPSGTVKDLFQQPVDLTLQAEQIYNVYPLKKKRPAALRAIKAAIRKVGFETLMEKTRAYAVARNGDLAYMPHPSTWFNQEEFNDDPSTWKRASTNQTNQHGTDKKHITESGRGLGTANEGTHRLYRNIGTVRPVPDAKRPAA
jgi:hypothetical protein